MVTEQPSLSVDAEWCGRRAFAEELRALMTMRGVSGSALARLVPCDAALICRYRSGKQAPSLAMARRVDAALGAEGALAALAGPGRRAMLAGSLLTGTMLAVGPGTRDLLAWAERHPPQIDGAVVQSLAELLTAQRRADDALGSAVMLQPALAQLKAIENLVGQRALAAIFEARGHGLAGDDAAAGTPGRSHC